MTLSRTHREVMDEECLTLEEARARAESHLSRAQALRAEAAAKTSKAASHDRWATYWLEWIDEKGAE